MNIKFFKILMNQSYLFSILLHFSVTVSQTFSQESNQNYVNSLSEVKAWVNKIDKWIRSPLTRGGSKVATSKCLMGYQKARQTLSRFRSPQCSLEFLNSEENDIYPWQKWSSWSNCIGGARYRERRIGCTKLTSSINKSVPGSFQYFPQLDFNSCNRKMTKSGNEIDLLTGRSNNNNIKNGGCSAWSECSTAGSTLVCDAGWQKRTCIIDAMEEPEICDQEEKEFSQACHEKVQGPWTSWSSCINNFRNRTRQRDRCVPNLGTDFENEACQSERPAARGFTNRSSLGSNSNSDPKIIKSFNKFLTSESPDCSWSPWGKCLDNKQVRVRNCQSISDYIYFARTGAAIQEQNCRYTKSQSINDREDDLLPISENKNQSKKLAILKFAQDGGGKSLNDEELAEIISQILGEYPDDLEVAEDVPRTNTYFRTGIADQYRPNFKNPSLGKYAIKPINTESYWENISLDQYLQNNPNSIGRSLTGSRWAISDEGDDHNDNKLVNCENEEGYHEGHDCSLPTNCHWTEYSPCNELVLKYRIVYCQDINQERALIMSKKGIEFTACEINEPILYTFDWTKEQNPWHHTSHARDMSSMPLGFFGKDKINPADHRYIVARNGLEQEIVEKQKEANQMNRGSVLDQETTDVQREGFEIQEFDDIQEFFDQLESEEAETTEASSDNQGSLESFEDFKAEFESSTVIEEAADNQQTTSTPPTNFRPKSAILGPNDWKGPILKSSMFATERINSKHLSSSVQANKILKSGTPTQNLENTNNNNETCEIIFVPASNNNNKNPLTSLLTGNARQKCGETKVIRRCTQEKTKTVVSRVLHSFLPRTCGGNK